MKKKYLIALLCGVLCVSALTGCQNSPAKEEEASAPELSLEPSQEQNESSAAEEDAESGRELSPEYKVYEQRGKDFEEFYAQCKPECFEGDPPAMSAEENSRIDEEMRQDAQEHGYALYELNRLLITYGLDPQTTDLPRLTLDDFKAIIKKCRPTDEELLSIKTKEEYNLLRSKINDAMRREIVAVQWKPDAILMSGEHTEVYWLGAKDVSERDQEIVIDGQFDMTYRTYQEKGLAYHPINEDKIQEEVFYSFYLDAVEKNPAIKDFIQ